ncbi:hypothetical protein ScalyP_jg6238 [Parmales sp. scaly parma]|nr:hypothetical protein ScalyP_jg6238 [Parmales sp. scaly parma]
MKTETHTREQLRHNNTTTFISAAAAATGRCQCQWEQKWCEKCPLHGTAARAKASRSAQHDHESSSDDEEVWDKEPKSREQGIEIQDHAGVGKATYGVRRNSDGWWVDKSEDVFHKNEMKVKFNKTLVTEGKGRGENGSGEEKAATRAYSLRNARIDESLNLAKVRFEESSKQIKQLESDLAASTQSIKSIVAREARQNTKFSYDERTKKILLREAEELSSARVKESFPSMPDRGSLLEGETEFPSHLRATYESDIDTMRMTNRVERIMAREKVEIF